MKKISLDTPLDKLGLPVRCTKHLMHNNYCDIETLGELVSMSMTDVKKYRNIGAETIDTWKKFLEEHGLKFSMSDFEKETYALLQEKEESADIQKDYENTMESAGDDGVDWEGREWQLSCDLFRNRVLMNNHLYSGEEIEKQARLSINMARKFIAEYKLFTH